MACTSAGQPRLVIGQPDKRYSLGELLMDRVKEELGQEAVPYIV